MSPAARAARGAGLLGVLLVVACGDRAAVPGKVQRVDDVQALADDVRGFAEGTTGGRGGPEYWVTSLADDGPGSLRAGAEPPGRRWIRFAVSGDLRLQTPVAIGADKTVDGRGERVRLAGAGLVVRGVGNVIVENLVIEDGRGDAIRITDGAHHVWVDHCTLARFDDGLIDVTRAATDVTVSWSRFREHAKVLLVSAAPSHRGDVGMRVTIHHNFFDRTGERHPRLRFGKVHAYNNYLLGWQAYGAASSMRGELLSEANVYEAGWDPDAVVTHAGRDPVRGYARSVDDVVLGGAAIEERRPDRVFDPRRHYPVVVDRADASLAALLRRQTGWRRVEMPARVRAR